MANNEFKNINDFIEGFTRFGETPKNYNYDGVIYGMDFIYKNKIYRITRDTISPFDKELHKKSIKAG